MSAALAILPVVWATCEEVQRAADTTSAKPVEIDSGLAFYRKYTEALLRRYVKMAMESGRTPSLLGREMFRGNVTHYRVRSFDDVVIFVYDVERCLEKLDQDDQNAIERIAMQEYTHGEAAELLGIPVRTLIRRYERALDALTKTFLERRILEPQYQCQEM
jgi:predicted DNA-binding protein (UPF0251 family)